MKYRIKNKTNQNGNTYYMPQARYHYVPFWFDLKEHWCFFLVDAQKRINNDVYYRKSQKFGKESVIEG